MDGRFWRTLFLLSLVVLAGAGCSSRPEDDSPAPTADPAAALQAAIQATMAAEQANRGEFLAAWLGDLVEAEDRWSDNPVTNYDIEVLYVESGRQVIQIHSLTVVEGEVVAEEVRCSEQFQNCIFADIPTGRFTVPGLFQTARFALENDEINANSGGVSFHETYGFPQFIGLRSPGANPLPWYWQVETFSVKE